MLTRGRNGVGHVGPFADKHAKKVEERGEEELKRRTPKKEICTFVKRRREKEKNVLTAVRLVAFVFTNF